MNPVRDKISGLSGVNRISSGIKKILFEAVKIDPADGLLFSGGLDSSILASINPGVKAITVSLKSDGEDIYYSNSVAKLLDLEHFHRRVDVEEAIKAIPKIIKILKTFDPAIPNDLAVYFGLELAKDLGISRVMTGDGGDELFAGYSFMQRIDNLESYIARIARRMSFGSNVIGDFLGIKIVQPFLNKAFINFSLGISAELKLKEQNGRLRGKWILRQAFEDILSKKIVWQGKRALEYGSGMRKLRNIISAKITDEEFKENSYPVKFMNKEHLCYYKIYMKEIGQIPKPKKGEKTCPGCGAGMNISTFHCRVCGSVLNTYHRVGDK